MSTDVVAGNGNKNVKLPIYMDNHATTRTDPRVLEEMLPSIQRVGGYFHVTLNELARKHPVVKEVRGFGLMLGAELNVPGKQIVLDAMAEGLLINCTHDTVLRFLPPYIVTEKEVDQAARVLSKILAKVK